MSYDYNAKSKASNKCNAQQRETIVSGEPDTGKCGVDETGAGGKCGVDETGAALLYSAGVPKVGAPPRGRGWVGRGRVRTMPKRHPTQVEVAKVVRSWVRCEQAGRGWREVERRVFRGTIPHRRVLPPMPDVEPVTAVECATRWLRRRVPIEAGLIPWRQAVRRWAKSLGEDAVREFVRTNAIKYRQK